MIRLQGRLTLALAVFGLLVGVLLLVEWFEGRRGLPGLRSEATLIVHVTSGADRGPGSLREALYLVATAKGRSRVMIDVAQINLRSALPPLVSDQGVRIVGAPAGAVIDAGTLGEGPVLDVAGANTSIEDVAIHHCPAMGILVRSVRFRLTGSDIRACDLGVEVAENASEILLEHNQLSEDRIGVRFGASGHGSALIGNQLANDKDAGLWAVRGSPDPHDEALAVRNNRFSADGNGVLAGNVPVLVERNEFINSNEAAVHIVGAGAIVRANHISGGASMGVLAENARDALIENNEIEGVTAYGVMVRGSASVLVRTNRLHNCGYGLAFVLDDPRRVSTALGNAILEPRFNGIDVIGDSPTLKRNEVLHARAYALRIQDFEAPHQPRTVSKPFLEENDFGSAPVSGAIASARPSMEHP